MLPVGIPERTLGWGVLDWGSKNLNQPDGDRKGEMWVYSDEQAMFILWFYSVDEYGKFSFRRAVLERPKGWGKSPLLAAICCTELLGPVRFSHFDDAGNPIGRPFPSSYVQIAAISEDQTNNTMTLVNEMLAGGAESKYGLSIGLSRVLAPGSRKLDRVTASPRSREGNRPSFVVMDETHLWVPVEKGPELANVLRRNLMKTGGRSIETTNAPVPGEQSVAEASHTYYEKIQEGTAADNMLLFDSREVVVKDIYDREQAFAAMRYVYGDAAHPETGWIDLERTWSEINDPATREQDARRFYFNQRVHDYSQWITSGKWESAATAGKLKKKDKLALGLKVVTRKSAAVVGCRITDGAVFLLGNWERPEGVKSWEVDMVEVDDMVRGYLDRDNVYYLCADPWMIQDIAGRWSVDYEDKVEGFWTRERLKMAKAVDQFEEALYGGRLVHANNLDLNRQVMNTFTDDLSASDPNAGHTLRQEAPHSKRYITAAQAAVLAFKAAQIAIENGCLDDPPDNTLYGL